MQKDNKTSQLSHARAQTNNLALTELMYEQILKTISASSPGSNAKRRGFAISVAIKSTRWRHPRLGLLSEVYTMGPSWPVASPRF